MNVGAMVLDGVITGVEVVEGNMAVKVVDGRTVSTAETVAGVLQPAENSSAAKTTKYRQQALTKQTFFIIFRG